MADDLRPVFHDPSGLRWRSVRGAALGLGILTSLFLLVVLAIVVVPPLLPSAPLKTFTAEGRRAASRAPDARARSAQRTARRRLEASIRNVGRRPAFRSMPGDTTVTASRTTNPLVVGFYVNWDDNSFASLSAHIAELDWVVAEWGFVRGGSDGVRWQVDGRVPTLIAKLPEHERPALLAMLTNVADGGGRFDPVIVRTLLRDRASRQRLAEQITHTADSLDLAGIVIDFEGLSGADEGMVNDFARQLRTMLAVRGGVVARTVPEGQPARMLAAAADAVDHVIVMLYDEHYGRGDPGPVASQGWFTAEARRTLAAMPASKVVLAVGTYGYDWNDAGAASSGDAMTFAEVMRAVRDNAGVVHFDPASLNPYATWMSPDSTDHLAWFLDATTAWNHLRVAAQLGAGGVALWRLGAEEPSVWRILGRRGIEPHAVALQTIDPPYDVEIDGVGEIIEVASRPAAGRRTVTFDPRSSMLTNAVLDSLPTPWVVRRTGAANPHRVALTFDDGPDADWTAAILDTLSAYKVKATFFIVGAHAVRHPQLMRRIVNDGHEFGNHTYTHPNLAMTPAWLTRLEIQVTERALEAITQRRTPFFRPPYFGDAEPTTLDELVPVAIATAQGYMTAGLHVESNDWQRPGVETIVANVLRNRARGQVVLLHDGGGERSQTVAALGTIIDSLRANGDTLVALSGLLDLPPGQAMVPLESSGFFARMVELSVIGVIGGGQMLIGWIFGFAVVVGLLRLLVLMVLALWQRRRPTQYPALASAAAAPAVSVIVPAYNESAVIGATVRSLLAQQYEGSLDVIVVDDGSPDGTGALTQEAFVNEPRVTVIRQANAGKARALNTGIAQATGEIIVCLDADTQFMPDTVAALVRPFTDSRVGAVAGNAKVGNRINLVTWWQALEYVTSQNVDRRAFALLNCITVVPGAVGAWRRNAVAAVGGFTDQTLAEDQDLTIALRREGWRIAYAPTAVAFTEAPDTFAGLARQRFRWSFGTLQCAWKHRDTLFRRRYGTLGSIAMPNTWIFQLAFTALSPLADLLFVLSVVAIGITWHQHGGTYALVDAERLLAFYVVFVVVDWLAAVVAFAFEPGEDVRLTWLIALQRFAYRQIMYWVVVRSIVAALRGRVVGWGTLERKGTVALPEPGHSLPG